MPVQESSLLAVELLGPLPSEEDFKADELRRQGLDSAQAARESLAVLTRQAWRVVEPGSSLEWNWHHEVQCAVAQALMEDWMRNEIAKHEPPPWAEAAAATLNLNAPVARRRMQNVLDNVPPGTAKSRIFGVMLNGWMWLHWPSWSLLALTASPRNALRDAVYTRNLLTSEWYQDTFRPQWRLSAAQNAKGNFWNDVGGFRLSAGYTSQVIGGRTDCLLIDDPHDPLKVEGPERQAVLDRWDTLLGNRVNDQRSSVRIILGQRVREDDLFGHVLQQDGAAWEHAVLPMRYEPGGVCECQSCKRGLALGRLDPRTKEGEVLHPARFTPSVLASEEKRLGSYGFAGQYQQRPAPKGGGMFPRLWWRFHSTGGAPPVRDGAPVARPKGCREDPPVPTPLEFDQLLLTVDANFKNVTSSDPAAIWAAGVKGPKRYVLARRTAHGFLATLAVIREMVAAWHTHGVLIETAANGQAVIETLTLEVSGVIGLAPMGGKAVRAAAMQPAAEAGDWLLPDGADWLEEVVGQFASFPRVAHDDDVDAASQLHAHLLQPAFALSY